MALIAVSDVFEVSFRWSNSISRLISVFSDIVKSDAIEEAIYPVRGRLADASRGSSLLLSHRSECAFESSVSQITSSRTKETLGREVTTQPLKLPPLSGWRSSFFFFRLPRAALTAICDSSKTILFAQRRSCSILEFVHPAYCIVM